MTKTAHITHSIKAALIAFVCDGDHAHNTIKAAATALNSREIDALDSALCRVLLGQF